jgi:D-alanyl-D-alanine carboxypeptidase/D-alanyl-D-alanine-endopeptidase (penicillin-binding protein 4)
MQKLFFHIKQNPSFWVVVLLCNLLLMSACSSSKNLKLRNTIHEKLSTKSHENHFIGLKIVDPSNGRVLFQENADKYFTPASNTKIFTLFTALRLLPDSIPTAKYYTNGDSIFIFPLGDPTQLHPYFKDSTLIKAISKYNHSLIYFDHFTEDQYGPGWAWEDYDQYFSPERSVLPLYGNVVTISTDSFAAISPSIFEVFPQKKEQSVHRNRYQNIFFKEDPDKALLEVPFITSDSIYLKMLKRASGSNCALLTKFDTSNLSLLYSIPSDSLFRRMMHESDNFLAEQMMILSSSMVGQSLSVQKSIDYTLDSLLYDIPQRPRWVDGSGLSRYNLFTPSSIIYLLNELYLTLPKSRLFEFFPPAGESGTLKAREPRTQDAYVFAKSGSLGNNYNLSGYLLTKSGKTLIFSYMNNHFRIPNSEIKSQIATLLKTLHETY